VATGDFERAAVLYGAGDALWTLLNAPVLMGPGYAEIRRSAADNARTQLGKERFDVLAAQGGAMPLPAALAVAMGGDAPTAGADAEAKLLTRREREVAALVADGLGNRDIAERLFLSKRTVDSHIEHIFTKMGFTSRTQLANWVLERGLPD
jgi:DNA-binding NarL/FixJ family response regulator